MFRIYHIDPRSGAKIYNCNRPGYWFHFCESPEDCVPYDDRKKAELRAAFDEKCVAPAGVERVVEEYEDSRKLIKNRYNGSIIPVDALRYMCESELSYDPIN